jgi:alkylation response protein AidB-like acyl-CoA dehydrogenase
MSATLRESSPASLALDPVARARAVAPLVAASSAQIERDRELPPQLIDALHAARLFRTLLPRDAGGEEVEPTVFLDVLATLAAADASTAWCVGQNSGCSMVAAYLPAATVRRIWGDDPRAALAWGVGPGSKAQVVDGGFRVTGKWQFASGSRHATWIGGHSQVVERDGSIRTGAGGALHERTMLFPRSAATFTDTWQVMGLRGTGSDTYEVRDLFVADDYAVCRDTDAERRQGGTLYRFTTTHLYASGFGAVAMGIARGMLDDFMALASDKTPSLTTKQIRESPVVQSQVALCEVKLQSARTFLHHVMQESWEMVKRERLTLDQRYRIRMAATFATHQAREVVQACYHAAGATAIFESNPFERRFRDMHAVTQQIQARFAHFEIVGAHLLGLPATQRWV